MHRNKTITKNRMTDYKERASADNGGGNGDKNQRSERISK